MKIESAIRATAVMAAGLVAVILLVMGISANHAVWTPLSLVALAIGGITAMHAWPFRDNLELSDRAQNAWVNAMRYLSAVIVVAAAITSRWLLERSFGTLPTFLTFYPAVLLTASLAGGGPGILATILSVMAVDYWVIAPGGFGNAAPNDVLSQGVFAGSSLFLCVLAERLRAARWIEAFHLARQQALREHSDELLRQNEELTQQSEELSQQSEEILQQSEELAQQNEELQTQSEEIQSLNTELQHREEMLQGMLDSARLSADEDSVLQDICAAAVRMFDQPDLAVVVYEIDGPKLVARARAGLKLADAVIESRPLENSFAELVISQNKIAALEDASLRPDLSLLRVPGQEPFRSVLAAPLRVGNRQAGAVAIYSCHKQQWTAVQFRLIEWLATQCARILETLRLQEAVRDNEERYRNLFNCMTEGFALHEILCDESGAPCDYRFLEINPAFESLTGMKRDAVVGHTYKELLPDDDPHWLEVYGRVALTGEPAQFVNYSPVLKKHFQVFAFRPAPRQFAVVFIDITERKQAEDSLRRMADSLERSNKDLEQFAYVTSHDLKEPLRMVTGFMSLLQDHCQGALDNKANQYIFYASDAASRMQRLIDDLLAYSRVGRGNGIEQTDLSAVMAEVLKSLSVSIEESAAAITCDVLPTIASNPLELTQVFQNLVGNAIKFRGDRQPRIHVGATREDGHWIFSVRDNGIGVDPQFADRVFMIFQRLHSREEYPGTGIGLAICKKIVERHGGRIWIESEPGAGSTFRFTIPDTKKTHP